MNWDKARDWEVIEGAAKGWDDGAIAEAQRRGLEVKLPPRAKGIYWTRACFRTEGERQCAEFDSVNQ